MKIFAYGVLALTVAACAAVHQEDLQSWVGRPVDELDKHPTFLTMQVVRTRTGDGTEIRNYINDRITSYCSGGGTAFTGYLDSETYRRFSNCMQSLKACNNIFYIKDGVVTQYTPVGTGGGRCHTDERTRPGFAG
jgi:hypothetical protein